MKIDWTFQFSRGLTVEALAKDLGLPARKVALEKIRCAQKAATRYRISFPADPNGICRDDACEIVCLHPAHDVRAEIAPPVAEPPGETLRQVILANLTTREVRPFSVIFAAVVDDYGKVVDRTVWRALERLLATAQVVKVSSLTNPRQGAYVRNDSTIEARMPYLQEQVETLFAIA